jgi:hypothetical protein
VIDEGGAPVLELNADVPDVRARLHEPGFRVAILPAAMRTVLLALRDEDVDQEDDPDSWAQRWFRFRKISQTMNGPTHESRRPCETGSIRHAVDSRSASA